MRQWGQGRRPGPRLGSMGSMLDMGRGFSAVRHRNFRLYWIGQIVSLVGTWMQSVSQPWLVLLHGGSPIQLEAMAGASIRMAPPLLGQHTFEILREFGYEQSALDTLADAAVISQHREAVAAMSAARPPEGARTAVRSTKVHQ